MRGNWRRMSWPRGSLRGRSFFGRKVAPEFVSAPVLAALPYSGQLLDFVDAVWVGVDPEDIVYRYEVNASARVGGDATTARAYRHTDADEEYTGTLYAYPKGFPSLEVASAPVTVSVAAKIADLGGAAVSGAWLHRRDDLDLVTASGKVVDLENSVGSAPTLSQATAGARPTPSATGINGMAAIQYGGGTRLRTADYALTGMVSQVQIDVFSSTNTSEGVVSERSTAAHANAGGQNVTTKESNQNVVDTYAGGVASGGYSMGRAVLNPSTPAVVAVSADRTLSVDCTKLSVNGGAFGATRPFSNGDLNNDGGTQPLLTGARSGGGLPLVGYIAGTVELVWDHAIGAPELAVIAAIVAVLKAWRGVS